MGLGAVRLDGPGAKALAPWATMLSYSMGNGVGLRAASTQELCGYYVGTETYSLTTMPSKHRGTRYRNHQTGYRLFLMQSLVHHPLDDVLSL